MGNKYFVKFNAEKTTYEIVKVLCSGQVRDYFDTPVQALDHAEAVLMLHRKKYEDLILRIDSTLGSRIYQNEDLTLIPKWIRLNSIDAKDSP